ncbi:hypothetical protein RAJCM14343_3630 [Rhodococcus aetherivorans]|uniref:Uncharacterized protein n=1 Tax=Rhodococcus aetherivorans TaxID=191292 RepID=A0ABQ0YP55_9NOCA|nr:hypothetical protein RAJCM14343_3630 [Rhodococcus aetherivorans]
MPDSRHRNPSGDAPHSHGHSSELPAGTRTGGDSGPRGGDGRIRS